MTSNPNEAPNFGLGKRLWGLSPHICLSHSDPLFPRICDAPAHFFCRVLSFTTTARPGFQHLGF